MNRLECALQVSTNKYKRNKHIKIKLRESLIHASKEMDIKIDSLINTYYSICPKLKLLTKY